MKGIRYDSSRVRLRTGEYERSDGWYEYRYMYNQYVKDSGGILFSVDNKRLVNFVPLPV